MPSTFRSRPVPRAKILRPSEPSAAAKGYGPKWRRYSEAYRKRHPFCAFCLQQGRTTLIVSDRTGVVDHKIPVRLGGPFWDRANHHGLCNACHGGFKARLEAYAEATGQVERLPLWCDDPASRPRFRGEIV